jgi:hypothetical protein
MPTASVGMAPNDFFNGQLRLKFEGREIHGIFWYFKQENPKHDWQVLM